MEPLGVRPFINPAVFAPAERRWGRPTPYFDTPSAPHPPPVRTPSIDIAVPLAAARQRSNALLDMPGHSTRALLYDARNRTLTQRLFFAAMAKQLQQQRDQQAIRASSLPRQQTPQGAM